MKLRLLSVAVMLVFAFFAIKVIAFKNTATRFDVIALWVAFVIGFGLSFRQAMKRREQQRAQRGMRKSE